MAQVPLQSFASVAPNPTPPGDYQNIQANPAAFGALEGAATQKLGANLDKASDDFTQIALMKQQRFNQIASDQAFNEFQAAADNLTYGNPSDPSAPKGFYTLTGSDALAAGPGVMEALKAKREQIKNGLQNDAQRLQFEQASRRLTQYKSAEISRHLDQQETVYGTAVNEATMRNAARSAGLAWNSDDALMHAIQDSRSGAVRNVQLKYGHDADSSIVQNAISQSDSYVIRSAIEGASAQNDPMRAAQILQKFGSQLDPDTRAQLAQHLRPKVDGAIDDAYLNRLMGGAASRAPAGLADAIHGQESGGRTISAISPKGAMGGWQIMPATFQQYARPGERIDNPEDNERVGRRIIDDLSARYNGDPARVAVAYFSGPGNVAPPGSPTPWIENRSDGGVTTAQYVAGVLGRMGGVNYPDESALVQQVVHDTSGDPERQGRLLSKLSHRLSVIRIATQTERNGLERSLPDLAAAALGGQEIAIPEDKIRRLLPPEEADAKIENLQIAQNAGRIFKSVQWAPPEDVQAAERDLSSGMGPLSTMIRHGGQSVPAGSPDAPETPEAYRQRMAILGQFEKQVQARRQALATDPAGYVSSEPGVVAAAAALQSAPSDPQATQAYVNATLTAQSHLGVPEWQQSVIPKAQAGAIVGKLLHATPDAMDVRQQLGGLAQEWGNAWPRAFGDLVKAGLPGGYQVLATMDRPEQAGAAVDLQRAFAVSAEKGGVHKLAESAPPTEVKAINDGVDDALDDFRQTVAYSPGGVALYNEVKDATKILAYSYAMRGQSGARALNQAVEGILNAKYDFHGTWRSPKLVSDQAVSAASSIRSGLTPADIAPINGNPLLTEDERKAAVVSAVHSDGAWINNPDDTGIILTYLARGNRLPVIGSNGKPIEIRFDNIPAGKTQPPAPIVAPTLAVTPP